MKKKVKCFKDSRAFFRIVFALLLAIYCLRFLGLDKDLPAYGVGGYNPTDEGVYSSIGLNLYNYGSINPEVQITDEITVTPYTAYHIRSNIIENVLVYFGLQLFGDNYFGFRAPIVFISLINFLLILWITWILIKKYSKENNANRWFLIIIELFYVISFPYLISSRVVEPTLVRMTFALVAYCVFLSCKKEGKKYFLTSMIITLSLQFAYVTNIFFYIPIFICGCLDSRKKGWKALWNSILSCILGCVLSLIIGAVYYYSIWGSNFITNTLSIFNDFSGLDGYVTTARRGLKAFVAGILDFLGSNAFLFCLPVLFCFLALTPKIVKSIIERNDTKLAFPFFSVMGLFLQTLFTNDYIFRKAFLILPFVIFSIVIYLLGLKSQPNALKKEYRWLSVVYTLLVVFTMLLIIWYRFFTNRAGTAHDFTTFMKFAVIFTSFIGIISVGFMIKKQFTSIPKFFAYILGAVIIFVNLYAGMFYVWLNNSYTERNLMEELDHLSGKPVFGAYSYGFTLYNDIKPVILTNDKQKKIVEEIPEDFVFIDTSTDNAKYIRRYLNDNVFANSRYTGIQKVEMPRAWMLDGKKIKFALYEIDLKRNVDLKNSLDLIYKKNNPFNKTKQTLLCAVADIKYNIDKKYEAMSNGLSLEEKYQLMIQQNNDLDKLYREYDLTDEDISAIMDKSYSEEDIVFIYGGTKVPLYGNVYGNIKGNVEYPIFGSVYGSVYGDVNAKVYGDVKGNVYGDVKGNVYGDVKGNVYGDVKEIPEFQ